MLLLTLVVMVGVGLGFAYVAAVKGDDARWLIPAGGVWVVAALMLLFSSQILVHTGEIERQTHSGDFTLANGTTVSLSGVDEARQHTYTDVAPLFPFNVADALGMVLIITGVAAILIGVDAMRRRRR